MEKGASEMEDYISRTKALEYIELIPWDTEKDRNRAIHHIRELVPPAADVRENRYGMWVPIGDEPDEDFECDQCGHVVYLNSANDDLPIFCPNCGATMTKEG